MMQLEKSLVYFSTSLKGNEIVLEKMMRMDMLRKYPEDADLLEAAMQAHGRAYVAAAKARKAAAAARRVKH